MYLSQNQARQGFDPNRLSPKFGVRRSRPYNTYIEGFGSWYNPMSWGRDDDSRVSTIIYVNPKTDKLVSTINQTKLARDRKDLLISFIASTMQSTISDVEKARKIGLAVNAMNAYLEENQYNSILLQLGNAFAMTAEDIRSGIADTSKNVWSSFKFLTNPVVLTSLALIAGGTLFYFYLVKPSQIANKML